MGFELYPHQIEALDKLRSGAILYGDVGSGKTLTSLAYYIKAFPKRKLYVITTAKKRDSGDWEEEAAMLGIQDLLLIRGITLRTMLRQPKHSSYSTSSAS